MAIFGNWSMKKTIIIVQIVIVVLVAASLISLAVTYYNTRYAMTDTVDRYDRLNHVFQYNEQLHACAREYLFRSEFSDEEILAQYDALRAELDEDFLMLYDGTVLTSTKVYFQGLQNMFSYYIESIDELIVCMDTQNKFAAYKAYNEVLHRNDLIKEVVVHYNAIYSNDVKAYAQMRIAEYEKLQINQMLGAVVVLAAALFFLSITLNQVSQKIKRLMVCTEHIADGDYQFMEAQEFSRDSDWGALGVAMQQMASSIAYYLGEMAEKSRLTVEMATLENERLSMYNSMREAELRALNNQMSPHFIYNTLNIALQTAYEEKAEKTCAMMRAIIDFLRYYTKNASAITDLYSELDFVRNYIFISKRRYGDRIDFSVAVMEGIPNIKLPAVTIQPLVENAIIHGLKDCTEHGSITISVTMSGMLLSVSVEDNGAGIEYERIEEVLSSESESVGYVGLRNVERRLKLFLGEEAAITIDSQVGCGTIVTLHMPVTYNGGR